MGDVTAIASYFTIKACDTTKITLHPFAATKPATVPGVPLEAEITESLAGTGLTPVDITYDQTQVKKDGTSKCLVFPAGATSSISFTVAGWADPSAASTDDSGAKTLAAAFTAGALAVAATQF